MQGYRTVNGENRMSKNRRFSEMLIPTIIMGVIAIALLVIGYYRG